MARTGRKRAKPGTEGVAQPRWRSLRNPYPPIEVLDADQLEAIHDASLDLLETVGIDFLDADARRTLEAAGAKVEADGPRVRFDRDMVLEAVARAPAEFTLHARNPDHTVTLGGTRVNFCSAASAPNCTDLDGGRRPGTLADYNRFLKLHQSLNVIHMIGGYPVEPQDVAPESRHLDCHYGYIALTDKVWHPYALGRERIADAIAMLTIATGWSGDDLMERPGLFTVVNTTSPLRIDGTMLQGLKEMTTRGQAVIVTPFTLSGVSAPVTLAGALAQQNAEILAVVAYIQILRPGAPCAYGAFHAAADMKSGAPTFGTPESLRATLAAGQLARRYGLPCRSAGCTTANAPDAQAGYESMFALWGAVMGHANMILHAAGWIESSLSSSFEKVVIDAEALGMIADFLEPITVDEATLAMDSMVRQGPGGNHLATPHTLERYRNAFHRPMLWDWRDFESWRDDGARSTAENANLLVKRLLEDYRAPALDPAVDEELRAFIERRRREIHGA